MDEYERNNELSAGSSEADDALGEQPAAEVTPHEPEAKDAFTPEAPDAPEHQGAPEHQDAPEHQGAPADGGFNRTPPFPGNTPPRFNQPPFAGPYSEPQSPYSPYSSNNYAYNPNPQPQARPQPSFMPPAPKKKGVGTGAKIFLVLVALLAVAAIGVTVLFLVRDGAASSSGESTPTTQIADGEAQEGDASLKIVETPASGASTGTALSTTDIAKRGKASNVGIVVYSGNSTSASSTAGEGSGIIMGTNDAGNLTYIITCAHVISGKGLKATVQTEDGTTYDAKIVGYDTRTDIGVLSVEATGLTAAEFGDSEALTVGEAVYAVGNPGGMEFFGSFTNGYVSAIDRPISSEIGYTMKCIQHTAAINPGNSGGALLNQYGQVIGINSQKITATDYEGMGFSIPITGAKEIIDALIAYGYVPNRPKLGITYYSVSASRTYSIIAQINQLPAGTLIIDSINDDSALSGTQAQQYDMITAVNGKPLTTADVLLEIIDNGKVGDKLTLTICRANSDYTVSSFDIEVTLVEDKGDVVEEPTTSYSINPFEDFYGY